MSAEDFAPILDELADALQPFLDGVDEGEVMAALDRVKAAIADVSALEERVSQLVDEPDEQKKLGQIVAALRLASMSLRLFGS